MKINSLHVIGNCKHEKWNLSSTPCHHRKLCSGGLSMGQTVYIVQGESGLKLVENSLQIKDFIKCT